MWCNNMFVFVKTLQVVHKCFFLSNALKSVKTCTPRSNDVCKLEIKFLAMWHIRIPHMMMIALYFVFSVLAGP